MSNLFLKNYNKSNLQLQMHLKGFYIKKVFVLGPRVQVLIERDLYVYIHSIK